MKTATRRSPHDRDRAIARLRAITLGTTIASAAAVGGFGVLAARSYDGSSTEVTTAALDSTAATTGSDAATSGTTTTDATGADAVQATPAPTTSTGTAHAATGSS